jgi:16S rRNA (uracil1498-N3)-methyltransferase
VSVTLLVSPAELAGETLRVEGDRYRHLFRARRLAAGSELLLVDGAGGARVAAVSAVDRRGAELRLGEARAAREPPRALTLLVAPPRPERTAWLVEKATELGVAAVRFVAPERAVGGVVARALRRLARVGGAAPEQCGGARLPLLSGPHRLDELPGLLAGARAVYLQPAASPALAAVGGQADAVLVGPEGGWTPQELAGFAAAEIPAAGLGERVLRVETAAVAAAALLLLAAPAG